MLNESNIPLEEDGIEEEILVEDELTITKAMWGDIGGNIANQTDLQNALDAKQDSLTETQLNAVNSGITSEKVTTYDGYADQIASKADQSALNAEATTRSEADTALGTRIDNEALARQQADNGLQSQIDAITSKSDVVDVVANYAALQAYDTSSLGNNDVIKVLDDETHEDALTYYRWSTTTQTWTYIGQEAPYYSKGQMDVKLADKQDKLTAGDNIEIQNGTISATDTTYTAGNGLNLNGTEFSADTDILATKTDLESYYTKPETDNLLAPKLEAEVVAELPTTGEEGKLYLTPKAHTTQTATGNPITATVAEEAGTIESFQLDGDTFQQTYEGKNLLPIEVTTASQGITADYDQNTGLLTVGGTPTMGYPQISNSYTLPSAITAGSNIVFSATGIPTGVSRIYIRFYQESGTTHTDYYLTTEQLSNVITATADWHRVMLILQCTSGTAISGTFGLQLEKSASATSFEPFVGGQPSPSPEYPQPIQTVTGRQIITINGTDYPLDLGTIELCGLGDDGNGNPLYKDRIYRDNMDWKIHKETVKAKLTAQGWTTSSFAGQKRFYAQDAIIFGVRTVWADDNTRAAAILSSHFTVVPLRGILDGTVDGIGISSSGYLSIRDSSKATVEEFSAFLANNDVTALAARYIPIDTVITDANLIAQLEAIRTAALEAGTNTITNTTTGSNLAGDMEIGYYGYNPTNRYDKWLWLDINNEYEQIGS